MDDIKDVAEMYDRILRDLPHKVCPECGHNWTPKAELCGYCGEKLNETIVNETAKGERE